MDHWANICGFWAISNFAEIHSKAAYFTPRYEGSVAIKIIQCSFALDLIHWPLSDRRKSQKSGFPSDQSDSIRLAAVNFTLYQNTGSFFSYQARAQLTGMRTDVFRTAERNGAERCGARNNVLRALNGSANWKSPEQPRWFPREADEHAVPRLFFRLSPSTTKPVPEC